MPVLYDADWAPSPRRVRIFLAEKGITVDTVKIDLRGGAHLGEAMLAMNPRGTLPFLKLDNGTIIDDSIAICRYFEALQPEPALLGVTAEEIALIDAWSRRVEAEGYEAVPLFLRNGNPRFAGRALPGHWPQPVDQIPALAERGKMMWQVFLDRLNARLEGRSFVAIDSYSLADIQALVTIDFGLAVGLPGVGERPALARWHASVSGRPSASA